MSRERRQLDAAIGALESQRATLGDETVDAALAPLRARLAAVSSGSPEQPASQVLRQATILFVDVVGSTSLSQRLDPEQTSDVMDEALAQFAGIVARHGGKVLKYAGDSVLAVFGADSAQEDDPERAVRAGLALLDEGRRQADRVRASHAFDGFDVRVGVHTGDVLLGGGVDAGSSVRGQAVNVAARMEQSAPAGALRISHDTYRHVRGLFTVEAQPPLAVKGLDEPVVTYLVLGARPRAFRVPTRGIEGVETRMIGRDAELDQLRDAFRQVCRGSALTAVTVVADAGVGKSRLLDEFLNWAESRPERFRLLQGRADPQTAGRPYGLLRDILATWLEIADSDSVDVAKEKIERGIAPLFVADDGQDMALAHAHLLGHLIGLDFSGSRHVSGIVDNVAQIRDRAFHAAAQLIRRIGAGDGSPVLLVLDDLHWADDGSLEFLKYATRANRDVSMLMVCLTRPSLFERRDDWCDIEAHHRRVDLRPLDRNLSQRLTDELLRRLPEIPGGLRELVVESAEGNPFYMEELVKMLVDRGTIEIHADRWTLHPARLVAASVPQTLTGVLQARLDSLEPAQKLALQQASVIGFVFWDQALDAIDGRARAALPGMTRRELVIPRQEASLDDVGEYAFHHPLLHQVTYDTVLRRMRREYHARAAQWMAGLTGARAGDFLGATAEHFELAGDDAQACAYFALAAEHAKARHANELALSHVARAMTLLDRDASAPSPATLALRWRLWVVREFVLQRQGNRNEQRAALDAMTAVADALDSDRLRAIAARRRSATAMFTDDYRTQERAAREAMTLAERAGDVESRLEAQRLLADALGALGDVASGEALARDGLAEARARGLRRIEGVFLNALSLMADLRGDHVTALSLDLEDLAVWRELGDPRGEAVALGNVGADWLRFGAFAKARQHLEDSLRLIRAIGARSLECRMLGDLSQVALCQGDASHALVLARDALASAAGLQSAVTESQLLNRVGEAEMALGNAQLADAAFARAESLVGSIGNGLEFDSMSGRARAALAMGDVDRAMESVEVLLSAHEGDAGLGAADETLVLMTCHQVLANAGDPRAHSTLASVHAAMQVQAATISDDALRRSFLANVPLHRRIVEAWAAQGDPGPARQGPPT